MICPVWKRVIHESQFELVRPFTGICTPAVKKGESVEAASVVAHCEVSAGQRLVKVANVLGVARSSVKKYMLRNVGDRIYQGEIIARTKGVFGVGKKELRSPADGVVTDIDKNGDIIVKFLPVPVRLVAGAAGSVAAVSENSITISTLGTQIKGATGAGKDREGIIRIVAQPTEFIIPATIDGNCQGKIIVGGAMLDRAAIEKALTVGVKGIVVGGINYRDFLSLGIESDIGLTVIITEGFGKVPMGKDIFEAFNKLKDKFAFINGHEKTVLIPQELSVNAKPTTAEYWRELKVGDLVRLFRPDSQELIGVVEEISSKEQTLYSGLSTVVATVKFLSGEIVTAPAANLEIVS